MTFTPEVIAAVDPSNSTTTPLAGSGTFTGTSTDVSEYNSVSVSGFSDVVNDAKLQVQFSSDGLNWDNNLNVVIRSNNIYFLVNVIASNMRVIFVNGATAQSTFRLQTILRPTTSSEATSTGQTASKERALISRGIDTFGRLRVASPATIFDSKLYDDNDPIAFDQIVTGSGVASYTAQFPYVNMSVGPASGRVVRQTRQYFQYQPGKAVEIFFTGTLEISGGVANVISRIGAFDDASDKTTGADIAQSNGFFFELDGTTFNVVLRSYITGVLVETRVAQADFNLDPLDGTGPSGVTFDPSQRQIFVITQQWLGVGEVNMGIIVSEKPLMFHAFSHTNSGGTLPYNNRASLPIRYEISTAGSASAGNLVQICSSWVSNGGLDPRGRIFCAGNQVTQKTIVTANERLTLAIRLNSNHRRATLNPLSLKLICPSRGDIYWVLYRYLAPLNPVSGGTWIQPYADSYAEYNVTGTFPGGTGAGPLAGGIRVTEGYLLERADSPTLNFENRILCLSDIAGNSDYILISMQSLSGTETCLSTITWQEYN